MRVPYNTNRTGKSSIEVDAAPEGETIETKVARITRNKEPIEDGAPIIFTDRKDGVQPQYNIKTDRFELAIDMTDKMAKEKVSKREEMIKTRTTPEGTGTAPEGGQSDK